MSKVIDISHYQIVKDWNAVKADGVEMVIIKATQGHALSSNSYLFTDRTFHQYIQGAINVGLPVGAYHFFTGTTNSDAIKEADYFASVIEPYKDKLDYVFCDAENYNNKYINRLSKIQLTERINVFCDRLRDLGYKPAHYTNTDHIRSYINLSAIPYPVWQADYITKTKPTTANLIAWQYTDKGVIAGITGAVDMNYGYFDIKAEPVIEIPSNKPIEKGDTVKVVEYQIVSGKKRAKLFNSNSTFVLYSDTYKVIGLNKQTGRAVISSNGITATAAVNVEILEKV